MFWSREWLWKLKETQLINHHNNWVNAISINDEDDGKEDNFQSDEHAHQKQGMDNENLLSIKLQSSDLHLEIRPKLTLFRINNNES